MSKAELLKRIKDEVVGLTASALIKERNRTKAVPVIGEGSHEASIVFVGEAPGATEAKTGRPFTGAAGQLLDELLESVGLKRGDVYITNLVKDRPPENRDPYPNEIELYASFLDRQLEIIKPKVVVALGRHAIKYLFGRYGLSEQLDSLSEIRGKNFETQALWGKISLIALYHPAVGLYNAKEKERLFKDFKVLKRVANL